MSRFLFFIPLAKRPTGGVNVIIEWSALLKKHGFESVVFSFSPDFWYDFLNSEYPVHYIPGLEAKLDKRSWKRKIIDVAGHKRPLFRRKTTPILELRHDDIIVIPEFASATVPEAFADHRCILLVQGMSGLLRAVKDSSIDVNRFSAVIATSYACVHAVRVLLNVEPIMIPLVIRLDECLLNRRKKHVIAYAPNKSESEAEEICSLLQKRCGIGDFELRRLENLSHPEFLREISSAAIFLSFARQEGFGLPPAEAMASGTIVIGYTGIGGNEYFDSEVGYPIAYPDLVAFIETVEKICGQYSENPEYFDDMKRKASERILSVYSEKNRDTKLLTVFGQIAEQENGKVAKSELNH